MICYQIRLLFCSDGNCRSGPMSVGHQSRSTNAKADWTASKLDVFASQPLDALVAAADDL